MPRFLNVEQGTPEWLKARCGFITASRIADVTSYLTRKSKNGVAGEPAASRIAYMKELRGERISGRVAEKYLSPAMIHGTEFEKAAGVAYEMERDVLLQKVGFVVHSLIGFSGASPDSLVDADGMIEIKCPTLAVHLDYLEAGVVPEEYEPQCVWGMEVCERKWCDFVSYNPYAFSEDGDFRLFIAPRLNYDAERAKWYCDEVIKFEGELRQSIARLRGGNPLREQLKESVQNDI